MYSIKLAEFEELPTVCALFWERGKEFDFKHYPLPEPQAIENTVYKAFEKAPCFLLKKDGEIIGFAGLTLDTFGWNDKEPFLCDYMVYIRPENRNLMLADMLEKAIIDFADFHGLRLHRFYIAVDRLDARLRFMRRHKYSQTGFIVSR